MASDFFRIYGGLELDEASQFLTGTTAPGSAGDTADAPRGSFFTDTVTGGFYVKIAQGTGTDKWSRMATQDYVGTVASSGLSWREPVAVLDVAAASTAALLTDLNTDNLIQGVAVTVGMRILGANITGNKNIFVVGGATSAWTLTEDLNLETDGDTTFVTGGDAAGRTYQYNNSAWTWINGGDQTELTFLRSFIGKDGVGTEMPLYTSTVVVANNDSLETGIGKLDAEVARIQSFIGKANGVDGTNFTNNNYVVDGSSLETAISVLDGQLATSTGNTTALLTYTGATAGDSTPDYSSNNFVVDNTSLTAAISALDAEVGANVSNGVVILAANKINGNITALDTELSSVVAYTGKTLADGSPDYSSTAYVDTGDNLTAAIGKLDEALAANALITETASVTTSTVVDAVSANTVEWNVFVRSVGTPTKSRSFKIFAQMNGTDVDYTMYATIKSGTKPTGLDAVVAHSGGVLQLSIVSTEAVYVRTQRVSVIAPAL